MFGSVSDLRAAYSLQVPANSESINGLARAIITHGRADHARSGHGAMLATPDTVAIVTTRPVTLRVR